MIALRLRRLRDDRAREATTARRADHLAPVVDEPAAQEGRDDPPGQLLALERRVALPGRRVGRPHRETLRRIDEGEIGIVTRCNIALAQEPEALRRIPGEYL